MADPIPPVDFAQLAQTFRAIADQTEALNDNNAFNIPAAIANMNQNMVQMNVALQGMAAGMTALQADMHNRFNDLEARLTRNEELSIIRMYNMSLSGGAALHWPVDPLPPNWPGTPRELAAMTVATCQEIAVALGLPPIAGGHPTVLQHRTQIMLHIGCFQIAGTMAI